MPIESCNALGLADLENIPETVTVDVGATCIRMGQYLSTKTSMAQTTQRQTARPHPHHREITVGEDYRRIAHGQDFHWMDPF